VTTTQTFFITGGNTGIGLATATALAADGGRVYLACRSATAGEAAVAKIKAATGSATVWLLPLDLASLASVHAAAEAFLALGEPLHVLLNNAGVAGHRGITQDGFELQFGVNHLGHFALTALLRERLQASGPGTRIVTVASEGHYFARGIDFAKVRRRTASFSGFPEYAVSKLCNVLFTQSLATVLAGTGVHAYSLHPGAVASDIWRRIPRLVRPLVTRRMITVEQGAATSLYCATSPDVAADTGLYYDNRAVREPSRVATPELAGQLWQHSVDWTGLNWQPAV
jgi:NAD(P)-dependent dehydrogenase (short-subunit alcohol dehydrogenase family)